MAVPTCGPAWRISPMGVRPCYVLRVNLLHRLGGVAHVCNPGNRHKWASTTQAISLRDVFTTQRDARDVYQARRRAALAANPLASLNLTTPIED